jgi:hypothetical protein
MFWNKRWERIKILRNKSRKIIVLKIVSMISRMRRSFSIKIFFSSKVRKLNLWLIVHWSQSHFWTEGNGQELAAECSSPKTLYWQLPITSMIRSTTAKILTLNFTWEPMEKQMSSTEQKHGSIHKNSSHVQTIWVDCNSTMP